MIRQIAGAIGKTTAKTPRVAGNIASRSAIKSLPVAKKLAASSRSLNNKGLNRIQKRLSPTQPKPQALGKYTNAPQRKTHALKAPNTHFNSQAHKQLLAKKGEDAAIRLFRKQGFNCFPSMKYTKVHGIDRAALQLTPNGKIKKAAIIEAKALREKHPSPSSFRKQTTHAYVMGNLLKAKNKGMQYASQLYTMARNRQLSIYGAGYNTKRGSVRLHKAFEPRIAIQNRAIGNAIIKSK
jgi:hypothetical protein